MSPFLSYLMVSGPTLLLLTLIVALAVRARRRRKRHRDSKEGRTAGGSGTGG